MEALLETAASVQSASFNVNSIEDLKKILSNRVMVNEDGVNYTLQVSSISSLQSGGEGRSPYYIVNFNAITPYHMELIKESIEAGDLTEATNHRISMRCRLGKEYLPSKNEKVKVSFSWSETKNREKALFVDTIAPLPAAKQEKFDLDSFLGL